MTLPEQLREDLKDAMRARDERRKSALRMALSAMQLAEVASSDPLEEADYIAVIRKEVKRREEAVEMMREGGREELIPIELEELAILNAYLPAMMSEEAITDLVAQVVDDLGATSMRDMGRVMGTVMPQVKGKADGKLVNQVVRRLLSS